MSGNNSWRSWAVVFVLLLAFALLTALWSSGSPELNLFSGGGGRVDVPSIPVEVEPIEFEVAALGIGPVSLSPILALGALAGIAVGGIVVVGAGLAFVNLLAARQVTAVAESDEFKEKQAQLEEKTKAELKELNEGRPPTTPDHNRPGWSALSTSLIILFFVWLVALIVNGTIYPEGQAVSATGNIINTAPRFTIPLLLITLLLLSIRMRPQNMVSTDSTDSASIPWDTIAVIFLGLLVVGLGLAAMMFVI